MSVELPLKNTEQAELDEDVFIEADSILADAKNRHETLFAYIDNIPTDQVADIVELSKVFDEACKGIQDAYEILSNGGDVDVESVLLELRNYSAALVRAEAAIYQLTTRTETSPSEDESDKILVPVEAPAVVEEPVVATTPSPSQKPQSTKKPHDQHVKDRLADQLFDNNSHDFLLTDAPDGAKRKKKPIKDLKADIATVFAARGVHGKVAADFFNTKFKAQHEEISHLVKLSQTETDKAKISEYREAINNAYEQIREDVIAEVMIAQPAYEESLKNQEERQNSLEESSPAQRGIEAIKDDIETARFYLDELRERHKVNDDFVNSPEYTRVIDIFKLADDCEDSDSNILNQKLEKYLTGLWPALDELTDKFTVGVGTESESKENIDATKPDVDSEKVEPADAATPEAISYPLSVRAPSERDVQREKWTDAKQEFRDVKKQYHEALEAHQNELKNRSMWEKMKSLGMKPEVPEAIKALETEYLARRKDYARELDVRLSQRGEKFELSQDDIKRAFVRKFLIAPQKEILEMQERQYLSPEKKAILLSVVGKLSKHKWTIRGLTVLAAGAAGAATGGTAFAFFAGAGMSGAKMGLNFGAGLAGGFAANKFTQIKVNKTTENLNKQANTFSLDSMDDIEAGILEANKAVASAKKQQKIATVVAGGLAGLATGAGAAIYENVTERATNVPTGLSEETLNNLKTAKIIPGGGGAPEILPRPTFIQSFALPFEGPNGTMLEHQIKDLSFGPEFKPAALSEPQTKELASFIKLKSDDILAAHPKISEVNFEKQLQLAVQNKFSTAAWWSESPVKSIDFKLVDVTPSGAGSVIPESVSTNQLHVSPEAIKGEYVVKSGDTLWEIAEEQFKDQLKHLSPSERNQVLDRLFDRVKEDPFLLESLSLQSGNNIERIYAGEKLELSGLQAELASELEKREIVEQFRKSAPLSVEADSGVKSVPITVVEKPIPGGTEVTVNNERSYTEASSNKSVPAKPVAVEAAPVTVAGMFESVTDAQKATASDSGYVPIRPELKQLAGNMAGISTVAYAVNKMYKEDVQKTKRPSARIEQLFGNPNAFDVAVERASTLFDSNTYDFFDTLSSYESPYKLLRGMTLADFAVFSTAPNAELRNLLKEKNMKYETYLAWVDKINEMREEYNADDDTTIGTLFERSVLEERAAKNTKNK